MHRCTLWGKYKCLISLRDYIVENRGDCCELLDNLMNTKYDYNQWHSCGRVGDRAAEPGIHIEGEIKRNNSVFKTSSGPSSHFEEILE